MVLNTYFKVIVFEIFVFEYDFRCTRTRTRENPYLPNSDLIVFYTLDFVEIESTDKEVIVLDHHRTIFIARSDTDIGPSKVKDIQ